MIEDHPIFLESMRFIRSKISQNNFTELEIKVLERLIHTSGDFSIQNLLILGSRELGNFKNFSSSQMKKTFPR